MLAYLIYSKPLEWAVKKVWPLVLLEAFGARLKVKTFHFIPSRPSLI